MFMKVLLLGSGAREHALAKKITESKLCEKLYVAPGNGGTAKTAQNVSLDILNFSEVGAFAIENDIQMIVVGPEDPLVLGISDYFSQDDDLKHIKVVGPSKTGASLEGSKEFAKEFMMQYNIPTASYNSFTAETLQQGFDFLETLSAPYVLKADGLAAGKGVLILSDLDQAKRELKSMLSDGKFGKAGAKVVVESFLSGIELSCFVLTDGKNYKILPQAKDYKRVGEGDTGLNTGGMGAISPVPFADEAFLKKVEEKIVKPTIQGIQHRQMNYKGFIFIGLIKVGDEPFVIEYNVRMGDPETEVVIPRVKNDILELFNALFNNTLAEQTIEVDSRVTATVMLVSGGYPEAYKRGKVITGIENVSKSEVYHAGTALVNNEVISSGGRVLSVTSYGNTLNEALQNVYSDINCIHFDEMYFRKDIGYEFNV